MKRQSATRTAAERDPGPAYHKGNHPDDGDSDDGLVAVEHAIERAADDRRAREIAPKEHPYQAPSSANASEERNLGRSGRSDVLEGHWMSVAA
jgi:hypothetical protein